MLKSSYMIIGSLSYVFFSRNSQVDIQPNLTSAANKCSVALFGRIQPTDENFSWVQ